jgi:hypothetical protein
VNDKELSLPRECDAPEPLNHSVFALYVGVWLACFCVVGLGPLSTVLLHGLLLTSHLDVDM